MEKILFAPFYNSSGVCTDTRAIEKNCLFICIRGERFDGNSFAEKALEAGAGHVIVDNPEFFTDSERMTLVEDSVGYLQRLANYHRRKFTIPVIGITGSNGKTTTKELVHAVLSQKYNVLATQGNLNNHLGVPLTLLRLTQAHEIAIIEMGANRFKDIEELCHIAEPTYGLITNVGKAHLEGFKTFEGVLNTKKELYEAIENVRGTVVYNADDEVLTGVLPTHATRFNYAVHSPALIKGILTQVNPFVAFQWTHEAYTSPVLETQLIGSYNLYNFLAAVSFGVHFDVPHADICHAISAYNPTNNRSQVKKTASNTLILDCYNANPTSMKSALESFALSAHPNKLFVLGDMKELGEDSSMEHLAVIRQVENLGLSGYTVGEEFDKMDSSQVVGRFSNTQELIEFLQKQPIKDKLILLKGSRSIGLEKLEQYL
jgi:UDP-N-acetylmuramoyl-tripeptide--D-alanyl-D-alanine ligase